MNMRSIMSKYLMWVVHRILCVRFAFRVLRSVPQVRFENISGTVPILTTISCHESDFQ